jgi:hypothetical protein
MPQVVVFGSFASTLSTFLSDVDVAVVVGQQRRYNTITTVDNKHKRWKGDAPSSERSAERSAGGRFLSDTPLGRTGLDCIEAWQSGVSDSSSSSSSSSGDDSGSDSEAEEECNAKSSNAKSSNGNSGSGSSDNDKSGSSSSSAYDAPAHTARYAK